MEEAGGRIEFAESAVAERARAMPLRETLGDCLIGHVGRDGTAIESREKPAKKPAPSEIKEGGAGTTKG